MSVLHMRIADVMKYEETGMNAKHHPNTPTPRTQRRVALWLSMLSILVSLVLSCRESPKTTEQVGSDSTPAHPSGEAFPPVPPDLSRCTRVEIELEPSTSDWICLGDEPLLTAEELAYVNSLKTFVVTDPDVIKSLAQVVRRGVYDSTLEGVSPRTMSIKTRTVFRCYQDGTETVSFIYQYKQMVWDGHWFTFVEHGPPLALLTPKIQGIKLRCDCALHLRGLLSRFHEWVSRVNDYPDAATWCDSFVRYYSDGGYSVSLRDFTILIRCPAAHEGKANYAMNPNCKPDSPPEMVLLFETRGGWNQHGGPELFTFDNHDPRGGCVLLNGGTVKFIRTEEELEQLRWK
jgi:hypothetical protein